MARTRWPPPGITSIAVPVAFSFAGKYGVSDGLWMLQTESSPLADLATTSLAVLPSEPGAPFGHRGISLGSSAASKAVGRSNETRRAVESFTNFLWCWFMLICEIFTLTDE